MSSVIGVIADVRESNAENEAGAQMFLPATKQFGPDRSEPGGAVKAASCCSGNKRDG